MRNRLRRREERRLLVLLDTLPEPDEIYAGYWMHEATAALLLFGSQTGGAIRKTRKLLKRLENAGMVERREWELGTSWRAVHRL